MRSCAFKSPNRGACKKIAARNGSLVFSQLLNDLPINLRVRQSQKKRGSCLLNICVGKGFSHSEDWVLN